MKEEREKGPSELSNDAKVKHQRDLCEGPRRVPRITAQTREGSERGQEASKGEALMETR